jgi:hypothetical protein
LALVFLGRLRFALSSLSFDRLPAAVAQLRSSPTTSVPKRKRRTDDVTIEAVLYSANIHGARDVDSLRDAVRHWLDSNSVSYNSKQLRGFTSKVEKEVQKLDAVQFNWDVQQLQHLPQDILLRHKIPYLLYDGRLTQTYRHSASPEGTFHQFGDLGFDPYDAQSYRNVTAAANITVRDLSPLLYRQNPEGALQHRYQKS